MLTFSLKFILFICSILLILIAPSQLYSCMPFWFLAILSWRKIMTHATISADPLFWRSVLGTYPHRPFGLYNPHWGTALILLWKIFFFSALADSMAVNAAILAPWSFLFSAAASVTMPLAKICKPYSWKIFFRFSVAESQPAPVGRMFSLPFKPSGDISSLPHLLLQNPLWHILCNYCYMFWYKVVSFSSL